MSAVRLFIRGTVLNLIFHLLHFAAVPGNVWLALRLRKAALSTFSAATDGRLESSGEKIPRIYRARLVATAIAASSEVENLAPGARDFVFEYSVWTQILLSSFIPKAVRPEELSTENQRKSAAAFFAAALVQALPAGFFNITDDTSLERFFRTILQTCVGAALGPSAIESAVVCAMTLEIPDSLQHAWFQGQTTMSLKQKWHDAAPLHNFLREVVMDFGHEAKSGVSM